MANTNKKTYFIINPMRKTRIVQFNTDKDSRHILIAAYCLMYHGDDVKISTIDRLGAIEIVWDGKIDSLTADACIARESNQ